MKDDLISRQAAIDAINKALDRETLLNSFVRKVAVDAVKVLPPAESELENKIRAIGYTGREGRIYIGGRLFAVRELPQ